MRKLSGAPSLVRLAVMLTTGLAGCSGSDPNRPTGQADAARTDASQATDTGFAADAQPADAAPADASPSDAGSMDATAPADSGPSIDAGMASAAFTAIFDQIILPKCGGSNCHLAGNNDSVYYGFSPLLRMPDAVTARTALVNMQTECQFAAGAPTPRVVPGNPAMSALMLANQDGLCGRRHNIVVPTVTPADMNMIEAWIMSGAM